MSKGTAHFTCSLGRLWYPDAWLNSPRAVSEGDFREVNIELRTLSRPDGALVVDDLTQLVEVHRRSQSTPQGFSAAVKADKAPINRPGLQNPVNQPQDLGAGLG